MLLNTHDVGIGGVLQQTGAWAWDEIERTRPYARGVVLDVGANIGTHTLIYAQTAQRVFAFEPQPLVFQQLCANLLLNNCQNVTPVQTALSSENGTTTMAIAHPQYPNSPANGRVGEGEYIVTKHTLDSLRLAHVDFIKIDVEGHELEVLRGARETLRRDRPVLFIEVHGSELLPLIESFLQEMNIPAVLKKEEAHEAALVW